MSPQPLPDPQHQYGGQQLPVPAHHRPPNVLYDAEGRPVHFTIGQPPQPPAVVQAPVHQSLSPELQRLIIVTFLILAVIVVCVGSLIAIVVMMGGTLIGIIGTVGDNLPFIGVTFIGLVLAAGWAASKLRSFNSKEK
ncbi:hypothetical protein [Streptomyces sp. NPDC007100]|uniref:hypothetical protein n=1 Tax=Streptomyces sp. NPDC007100 TaxID=3155602 RepID=UPI00340B6806